MVVQELAKEKRNVSPLCDALGVSRSAYYAWQRGRYGSRALANNRLRPAIRSIFREHKRRPRRPTDRDRTDGAG